PDTIFADRAPRSPVGRPLSVPTPGARVPVQRLGGNSTRARPPGWKKREATMANETVRLAEYAAGLRFEDLPAAVVQRAKDCITDTVAVIVLGNGLPWSQIISRYAQSIGAGGRSRILGA